MYFMYIVKNTATKIKLTQAQVVKRVDNRGLKKTMHIILFANYLI